ASFDDLSANPNAGDLAVVAELKERGLVRGYGDFWNANLITYFGDGELDVLPVTCNGGTSVPFVWFVDRSRFEDRGRPRSFYIAEDRPDLTACSGDDATTQFGPPIDTFVAGGRTILVFDYDIGERLPR
ncbi:MAG TPA: hypothetical protein VF183_10110, partial [Acidimicrobiales bacterium]